ncbi:MAG TPA: transposase [Patescibacteria group bacterium]|nr:transposase [Patescibacteria group bacterium]
MASRNTVRQFDTQAYYHIYNRGVEKRTIFADEEDYAVFLAMLKRHLSEGVHKDKSGRPYQQYRDIELLAFCLMKNHYHLFIYQNNDAQAFSKLLRSVGTAYTAYFNRKYKRVGHLFQERFKASRITTDGYLQHISRYIHLNPSKPLGYEWSSLPYYLGQRHTDWVRPARIVEMFSGPDDYRAFVKDYADQKQMLDEIKHELANF